MAIIPETRMGWCMTGHHAGTAFSNSRGCPGKPPTDPTARMCTCWCHSDTAETRERLARLQPHPNEKKPRPDVPSAPVKPAQERPTEPAETPKLVLRKRRKK